LPGRIHVVDDDDSFRTAIERRLKLAVTRSRLIPRAAIARLPAGPERARRILLDVQYPASAVPNARASQQTRLRAAHRVPDRTCGYADYCADHQGRREDFLTKPVESAQLLGAIRTGDGTAHHRACERHKLGEMQALVGALTPRERQVFGLVVRGRLNKQIAHELGTTERTIKATPPPGDGKDEDAICAELVLLAERLDLLG